MHTVLAETEDFRAEFEARHIFIVRPSDGAQARVSGKDEKGVRARFLADVKKHGAEKTIDVWMKTTGNRLVWEL